METLILDSHDIRKWIRKVGIDTLMREMIDRLRSSFKQAHLGEIKTPARAGFSYHRPRLGLIEWMPGMRAGGPICVKMVGYHPSNPASLNLPTILSTVLLYDTQNGHLLGLADATFLTALRTGAASAVASGWLAKQDAQVLGLIGCGAQAVTQAHALGIAFPELTTILYHDSDDANAASLRHRIAPLNLQVTLRQASLDELVSQSDILCTATSVDVGSGPVFAAGNEQPWLHVNAVGSDFPGKTEVPVALLRRAFVCPDFLDQAMIEGECQQLRPDEVGQDLGTIANDPSAFARFRDELTVFDSTGWAVEDLAAMELLMSYADELQLGRRVELETISDDPLNPYDLAQPKIARAAV